MSDIIQPNISLLSRSRTLVKPKYSHRLTRPITPGIIQLAQAGSFDEWLKSDQLRQEFIGRMYDLLNHYKIDPSGKDCWFALACGLASDHIPGLTVAPYYKGRGRPRKINPHTTKPIKRRGRPKEHTLEDAIELVRIVEGKKLELQQVRGKRITDKETLTELITHHVKGTGRSAVAALAKERPRLQRLLSESRKKIREIRN